MLFGSVIILAAHLWGPERPLTFTLKRYVLCCLCSSSLMIVWYGQIIAAIEPASSMTLLSSLLPGVHFSKVTFSLATPGPPSYFCTCPEARNTRANCQVACWTKTVSGPVFVLWMETYFIIAVHRPPFGYQQGVGALQISMASNWHCILAFTWKRTGPWHYPMWGRPL